MMLRNKTVGAGHAPPLQFGDSRLRGNDDKTII